jgi:flagellar basal body-associated protein FliL
MIASIVISIVVVVVLLVSAVVFVSGFCFDSIDAAGDTCSGCDNSSGE